MVLRIIVAHGDREGEMPGDSEQGPCECYIHPVCTCTDHVHYVLEGRESESDGGRIDYSVVAFVKFLAVSEQQPEHQQLGSLFRDGSTEECYLHSLLPSGRLGCVESHVKQWTGDEGRQQGRDSTETEAFEYKSCRLRLRVLVVNVPKQDQRRRYRGE